MKISSFKYAPSYIPQKIAFAGANWNEKSKQYQKLIHETSFFRELKTDDKVKKYILNTYKASPEILVVMGACSTGEEVYSQAIMLDEIKDKVKIVGFDISNEAVERAKQASFSIQSSANYVNTHDYIPPYLMDSYLAHYSKKPLDELQTQARAGFREYFDYVESGKVDEDGRFLTRDSKDWRPIHMLAPDAKRFALKSGYAQNCEFKTGNITNLDEMFEDNSINAFFFRNAFYHILTHTSDRIMNADAYEDMQDIASSLSNKIKPRGLFVIGEKEKDTGIDVSLIDNCMQNAGFIRIDDNIWQKA